MFDPAIVTLIMAGALGLTVVGVTEAVKKLFKATGILAKIVALAVSAGGTAYYLISTATFTVPLFIGYTLLVFVSSTGIYTATKGPSA
jgi:hypothetical protein